jgi:hypothetical protein
MEKDFAIQLKGKGFQQEYKEGTTFITRDRISHTLGKFDSVVDPDDILVVVPSLSEIISSCAHNFVSLVRKENGWEAKNIDGIAFTGTTPEDCVSALWIQLKESQKI